MTPNEAHDDIQRMLDQRLDMETDVGGKILTGLVHSDEARIERKQVIYENLARDRQEEYDYYLRVKVNHVLGQQETLGGAGARMFSRSGFVSFIVNIPANTPLHIAYFFAKQIMDVYEGNASPNGVWFRNVRINELGENRAHWQLQVLVDFEYEEVK